MKVDRLLRRRCWSRRAIAPPTNGPVVSSIYDFADRLKSSNPRNRRLATQIDEVLVRNVGPKP